MDHPWVMHGSEPRLLCPKNVIQGPDYYTSPRLFQSHILIPQTRVWHEGFLHLYEKELVHTPALAAARLGCPVQNSRKFCTLPSPLSCQINMFVKHVNTSHAKSMRW